jgi:hypothetical protein
MTFSPTIDFDDGSYTFYLRREVIEQLEIRSGQSLDEIYAAIGRAQFHDDHAGMAGIDPVEIVRWSFLIARLTDGRSRAGEVNGDANRFVEKHLADNPARARLIALALMEPWILAVPADEVMLQRQLEAARVKAGDARPAFETSWMRTLERVGVDPQWAVVERAHIAR